MRYVREKLTRSDMEEMRIPQRFWSCTLDGVQFSAASLVRDYVAKIDEMFDKGAGLFLHGPNGIGKTGAAVAILKHARRHLYTSLFLEGYRLRELKIQGESFDGHNLFDLARRVQYLVIDDYGKEAKDAKGFLTSLFEELVRSRSAAMLPTIVTSNASIESMVQDGAINPTTQSVMIESFMAVSLTGKNLRVSPLSR